MDSISMEDELGMVSETIISSADKQNHVDHIYGLVTDSTSPSSLSNFGMTASVSAIRGRSKVWNEFAVTPDGKKVACRLCGDCLAYSNSHSTSSMLKHLKRKHNLDLYPQANGDDLGNSLNSDKLNGPSPPTTEKRNRPKLKKVIPKDVEETDTSIQHGPLQFKDPCVRMKWTDHSDTFLRTFSSLYSDESYTDVTLVAEKQYFKAHRVILSSASDFFDDTFKMTPFGQHPIIFLKDIKAMDLRILLDFIYKGEVSIPPSLIPGLVKVGSELRVRGLSDFVWNEQLASNIFQPQPQSSQTTQNAQQTTENRARPAQQIQPTVPAATQIQSQPATVTPLPTANHNPSSTAPATGAQLNSTVTSPNKMFSPVRAVLRHTQPLLGSSGVVGLATSQPQQQATTSTLSNGTLAGVPRTYSRILNIRPTSPASSSNVSGQFITGDLSAVCSSVASTFPAMKRIRIVTSAAGLAEGQKQVCKIGTDNTSLQTFGENDTGTETVLMVTNEGETMLSTTQGGVTVLTPNTSMALPVGLTLKDTRYNSSNPISTFQNTQLSSQPVTVLTSSQSQSRSQELDEVVYSITELPGSSHEVLMAQDHEMVVCDDSGELVEKKPFLSA